MCARVSVIEFTIFVHAYKMFNCFRFEMPIGSHVIEHERQKMSELKKKSHDEARAQYLQLQNNCDDR